MSRYIDADIAKEKLKEYCVDDDSTVQYWYELMGIDDCIDKIIPIADVRENVRGEWTEEEHADFYINATFPIVHCNRCDYRTPRIDRLSMNFCPNCGADMRTTK